MSHANAALTPKARLRLARLIVKDGWSVAAAAKLFMVSWPTARRWELRHRTQGKDGMNDNSSRPHTSLNRTSTSVVRKIVARRWRKRLGPVHIAYRLVLASPVARRRSSHGAATGSFRCAGHAPGSPAVA